MGTIDVHVLSRDEAEKRIPDKRELLIGILDSQPFLDTASNVPVKVPPSRLRLAYLTYTVDDIQEPYKDYILMTRETAEKMLTDFYPFKNRINSLAVHCRVGESRSPAVTAALLDCFYPKQGSMELFDRFPYLNRHVYSTIAIAGIELGLIRI